MRATALSLVATLAVLSARPAALSAQSPSAADQSPSSTSTTSAPDPFPSKGPAYSVDRVRRELRQLPPTTTTEKHDGLKLEYYIQVFGSAPTIDLFKGFDLKNGQVPFTSPTHQDMLQQMTPQQYRHPVADIPSLLMWLGQQISKKKK